MLLLWPPLFLHASKTSVDSLCRIHTHTRKLHPHIHTYTHDVEDESVLDTLVDQLVRQAVESHMAGLLQVAEVHLLLVDEIHFGGHFPIVQSSNPIIRHRLDQKYRAKASPVEVSIKASMHRFSKASMFNFDYRCYWQNTSGSKKCI